MSDVLNEPKRPNDKCAECSHERQQHIYHSGPCRPGFECHARCEEFTEKYGYCPSCGASQTYDPVALGYHCQGICLGNTGYWKDKYERLRRAAINYASDDNLQNLHELLDAADVPKAGK